MHGKETRTISLPRTFNAGISSTALANGTTTPGTYGQGARSRGRTFAGSNSAEQGYQTGMNVLPVTLVEAVTGVNGTLSGLIETYQSGSLLLAQLPNRGGIGSGQDKWQ